MQSNMTSSTDTMVNKTNLAPIFTVLILKQRDGSTGEHLESVDWVMTGVSQGLLDTEKVFMQTWGRQCHTIIKYSVSITAAPWSQKKQTCQEKTPWQIR